MKAVVVELPAFNRYRAAYLNDDGFRDLQNLLIADPRAGDVTPGGTSEHETDCERQA